VNFRNARIVQHEFIVGSTSNVKTLAAGLKDQRNFARATGLGDTSYYLDIRHRRSSGWYNYSCLRSPLCLVFLSEIFFKLSKVWIDRNAAGKDVYLGFNIDAA
jgi:hypothetical protein